MMNDNLYIRFVLKAEVVAYLLRLGEAIPEEDLDNPDYTCCMITATVQNHQLLACSDATKPYTELTEDTLAKMLEQASERFTEQLKAYPEADTQEILRELQAFDKATYIKEFLE